MKPFGRRVRAAALPSRTDGYCWNSQGQRDVGIGGGAVQAAANAQECIHREKAVENRRALLQIPARTRTDFLETRRDASAGSPAVFRLRGLRYTRRQQGRHLVDLLGLF